MSAVHIVLFLELHISRNACEVLRERAVELVVDAVVGIAETCRYYEYHRKHKECAGVLDYER